MTLRAVHERYRPIGLRDSLALLLMLALALVLGMLIASIAGWGQHKAVLGIIALIALAMLGIFLEPANRPTVSMAKTDFRSGELRGPEVSTVLLDISRAVSSTLNLKELLRLLTQRTAAACGADVCSIFLWDPSGDRVGPMISQKASGGQLEGLWEQV